MATWIVLTLLAAGVVKTPDLTRILHEVAERIKTVGSDGGLILAPTHHLQLDTPLDNFWALLEAVTGRSWAPDVLRPSPI